jgi:hypothetical protein
VELLPSSALYGANAFNGILFMTSQSPFTSQGLCVCQIWTNKSKAAGTNDYVDYGIRMAHAFSPKLAAKLTLPICAVQIGMLQTTTTKRTLVETEVM